MNSKYNIINNEIMTESKDSKEQDECLICFETSDTLVTYYPCGHELCGKCFEKWNIVLGNRMCYICRNNITPEYIDILSQNQTLEIHNTLSESIQSNNSYKEHCSFVILFVLKMFFLYFWINFFIGNSLVFVFKYYNVKGSNYISITIKVWFSFCFVLIYEFIKFNGLLRPLTNAFSQNTISQNTNENVVTIV